MSERRVWLLRHGQSEWNAAGRWQGHGDPPLSPDGRAEAARLAEGIAKQVRAAGVPVRVFSSDLVRAVETAAAVAERLNEPASRVPALRELDVGTWSGLTRSQIDAEDAERLAAFDTGDPDVRPGGGETRSELRTRVRAAVEILVRENPEADLLLVVHLGVIRALVPEANPSNLELLQTTPNQIRSHNQP